MTSVPIFFPYLGSKRVLLQDQGQPKSLIKYSDYIVQKPRLSAPRSISPQAPLGLVISHLRIPQPPKQNSTLSNSVMRASSTDLSKVEERKPMLPVLYKSPVSKRESTPEASSFDNMPLFKLNPVTQSGRRFTSSIEGRRRRSFRVREATPVNRSLPGIKEFTQYKSEHRSEHTSVTRDESEVPRLPSKEEARVLDKKSCDLTRMYFNVPTQPRSSLPILIIHFEGILGTCLIQVKSKVMKKSQAKLIESTKSEYFFIKKDAKGQLKQLAKLYLIVIIFPSASERYKNAMKYLLHHKFFVDAAYYKTQETTPQDKTCFAKYLLDYNNIVKDFNVQKNRNKILLVQPINLPLEVIQEEFMFINKKNKARRYVYDMSSLLHFFPKIDVPPFSLNLICVPNFLLDERNEDSAGLAKCSFASVAKMISEINEIKFQSKYSRNHESRRGSDVYMNFSIFNTQGTQGTMLLDEYQPTKVESKSVIGTYTEIGYHDTEYNMDEEKMKFLRILNLERFLGDLEKLKEANIKHAQIENIKKKNQNIKGQVCMTFHLSSIHHNMINDLAEEQRLAKPTKPTMVTPGKVMILSAVSDLVSCNEYLFRLYEKNIFYTDIKSSKDITGIVEHLEGNSEANAESQKEALDFPINFRKKSDHPDQSFVLDLIKKDKQELRKRVLGGKNSFDQDGDSKSTTDTEEENFNLEFIKRIAPFLKLYIEN